MNWIPIFKTGTHTDSAGNTKDWTEQELDNIVEKYNPAEHEAPVVIGHPKDNAPAWAWIEGLKRVGQTLYMKMKDIVPTFAEMLKLKMFKKRSISLYPDGSIRHVGFLGANPPAVKGLADVAFSEGEQTIIEFNEEGGSMLEEIKKMFADMMTQIKGMTATKGENTDMTEKEIQDKVNAAVAAALKTKDAEFTEATKKKETEFSERETALRTKEDALKAEAAARKKVVIIDFCEGLKKEGKLIPAMEKMGMGISEFMNQISTIETTVEFSEGDKKVNQTPLEFMQAFLSALPKQIEFGEVAKRATDAGAGNAGEKLTTLTKQKMEAKKDLNYTQAFSEVQIENPELAAEYAEELKG